MKGDHQSDIQTTLVTRTQKMKIKSLSIWVAIDRYSWYIDEALKQQNNLKKRNVIFKADIYKIAWDSFKW